MSPNSSAYNSVGLISDFLISAFPITPEFLWKLTSVPFWLSTVDSNVAIGNDKLASEEAAAVQLLSTKWTREQGWGKTVTRECNLSAQQIYFDRPATIECFGRFNDDNKELGKLFLLIYESIFRCFDLPCSIVCSDMIFVQPFQNLPNVSKLYIK